MATDVFISYYSKDQDQAEMVRASLEKNQISCWMAPDSIPGGSNYAKAIPSGIKQAQVFVLVMSERTQSSIWVPRELDIAVNAKKLIIPFLLEDVELTDEYNFYLIGSQFVRAYLGMEEKLQELAKRIQSVLVRRDTQTAASSASGSATPGSGQGSVAAVQTAAAATAVNTAAQTVKESQGGSAKLPVSQAVEQFLNRGSLAVDPVFQVSDMEKLRKNFKIPASRKIILAHDDSWFGRCKNGFAFCSDGIYVAQPFGDSSFVSWEEFASGIIAPEDPEHTWKFQVALPDGRSKYIAYVSGTQGQQTVRPLLNQLHQMLKERTDLDFEK